MATKKERRRFQELADSGDSPAAIQFLQDYPDFPQSGRSRTRALRIMAESGDKLSADMLNHINTQQRTSHLKTGHLKTSAGRVIRPLTARQQAIVDAAPIARKVGRPRKYPTDPQTGKSMYPKKTSSKHGTSANMTEAPDACAEDDEETLPQVTEKLEMKANTEIENDDNGDPEMLDFALRLDPRLGALPKTPSALSPKPTTPEPNSPILEDDRKDSRSSATEQQRPFKLQYQWREARSAAGTAATRKTKQLLELKKKRDLVNEQLDKEDANLEPEILDECYEDDLMIGVVQSDIAYHERQMEIAELQMRACSQGYEAHEDLTVARNNAREAWYVADTAFCKLALAFPNNEEMERPAAAEK